MKETTQSVLLRTLSFKSIMPLGRYKDMTIQNILDNGHNASLRWYYYNISGISFNEEILRQIGVLGDKYDNRIVKPGRNPEICNDVFDINMKAMKATNNEAYVIFTSNKKKAFKKSATKSMLNNSSDSKFKLKLKNQGHNTFKGDSL